ncbi:ferrous iron transport protein B [Clostridium sp. MSJ-11]|uniref:Ferrous iron transport protein B n=1 Tax=Clostridium mobile TaxID=2841512 RepID=A0ABS6EKS3_9CLOT|nr:ferrous iron transport protein B [Clostridium mobile]MBU5485811.1 ferrous iron transport protein B [Clostridium mobile]
MGLTNQSTGLFLMKDMLDIKIDPEKDIVIALAGNPNTGKSTLFNSLTGMKQHTGNWTGKTVTTAHGSYEYKDKNFILVDLPGTYSLLSNSAEEEIARDFICFGNPNATIVIADATCLERNLNLLLQTLEMTDKVVLCVNLIDEANRKKININLKELSNILGIPVVGTSARSGYGVDELMEAVYKVSKGEIITNPLKIKYNSFVEDTIEKLSPKLEELCGDKLESRWLALKLIDGEDFILKSIDKYLGFNISEDESLLSLIKTEENITYEIASSIVKESENVANKVVHFEKSDYNHIDRKIDDILTSKTFGIPIMILMLALIFWFTIKGANYPSQLLSDMFFFLEDKLTQLFLSNGWSQGLHDMLVLGVYRTLGWVISVMLPPMAIFFPLFTLLEDLGYLPRVAFNLDNFFKKACAHGKQALTMCMGFGCNAAGVIGCRIIDSPRERLIAIITNFFVPCNGRFPTLIAVTTIFIAGASNSSFQSLIATLTITGVIVLGVIVTLLMSKFLSKTILKGVPSSFTLELPPYRKPQVGKILVRSILDRTIFVLGRAVAIAAPAGLIIWIMANIKAGNMTLLDHSANFLNPFAQLIGMDGYILMAFILGLPANEIVMPILIMSYMSTGAMIELDSLNALRDLLVANGWTWLTAINVMLFCLMHFPCGTTLLTIKKETQSWKWTAVSFILPTALGILTCFTVTQVVRLFI